MITTLDTRRNTMADIQQLEDAIVSLSLLEASALVKKLEERLGVSAAAAVAAPARLAAAVQQRLRLKKRPSSPSSSRMPARTRSRRSRWFVKSRVSASRKRRIWLTALPSLSRRTFRRTRQRQPCQEVRRRRDSRSQVVSAAVARIGRNAVSSSLGYRFCLCARMHPKVIYCTIRSILPRRLRGRPRYRPSGGLVS